MITTRYTTAPERREGFWRFVALMPLAALLAGAMMSLQHFTLSNLTQGTEIGFCLIVPLVLWNAGRYLGTTTTDSQGIRTRAALGARRRIPWSDVTSVEIVDQEAVGNHLYRIQVLRSHGRPVKLPGLASATFDDRRLVRDLKAIRADWETATGRIAAQV